MHIKTQLFPFPASPSDIDLVIEGGTAGAGLRPLAPVHAPGGVGSINPEGPLPRDLFLYRKSVQITC